MLCLKYRYSLLIMILLMSCKTLAQKSAPGDLPVDPNATTETVNLYHNLFKLQEKGFLFGHQDDLAYGVHWRYEKGRSDVKDVTGDYPGIYGWDLAGLEHGNEKNGDGVPFKQMKKFIREGYDRGGVITITWHAPSPLGAEKGSWDTTHGTVTTILPGGQHHLMYKEWLDHLAEFLGGLKGKDGEAIPVLFRPFHEHSGTFFWWGSNTCTPEEFKTLWRFTIYYLRDVKNLHNLLYVFNTNGAIESKESYLSRYAGDEWADVLSFDSYQWNDPATTDWYEVSTNNSLKILDELGQEKHKPVAFAETGYEAIPYANWWSDKLVRAIGDNKIAYVLVWRNHGWDESRKKMHYYVPVKGDVSEADFIKFYNLKETLFNKEAAAENLYKE